MTGDSQDLKVRAPSRISFRRGRRTRPTRSRRAPEAALLYRLNGDRNPLHADPRVAGRAGFARPILHGLATYGIACRAVLRTVCDCDAGRVGSFDARFSAPVYPDDRIVTDMWTDGDVVSFRCRVPDRDVIVLNNGRCFLARS
ncbi:MaoC family dehydratase [Bradyrhizobium sp. A11]|uniref:MaoC family dehydratase n=1 Tax=Bradyrhizobium sp. A11 TaxID=3133974 RepID=UPI00324D8D6C